MNGGEALVAPVALVLRGEVGDLPQGTHLDSVVVRVAGRSFQTVVNGRSWAASLVFAGVGEMVAVEASAGPVRYRAFAGTVGSLARRSADDTVTAAESPTLVVDSLSTAYTVVQRAWLGGRDPVDDYENERSRLHISGGEIASVGYLLQAWAHGGVPLPAGFVDGLAAAESPTAVDTALRALPPGRQVDDYLRTRPIRAPMTEADLPRRMLLRGPVTLDHHSTSTGATLISRSTAGGVSFLDYQAVPDANAQVEPRGDGTLIVRPAHARTSISYPSRPDLGGPNSQVKQVDTLDTVELRRLQDGERVHTIVVTYNWIRTFPDFPAVPPERISGSGLYAADDMAMAAVRSAWVGVAGQRRTFPVPCAGLATTDRSICDTAIHRFDHGGTGLTEDVGYKVDERMQPRLGGYGRAFSWIREQDGALVVTFPDAAVRAWSTYSLPGVDSVVYVAEYVHEGKRWAFAASTFAIDATTVPFGPSQAMGSWGLGFARSVPYQYLPPADLVTTTLERYANAAGAYVSRYPDGPIASATGWTIAGERVYDARFRVRFADGVARQVTSCSHAASLGATHCSPSQIRYFRPLRRVGARVYGIEELHSQGRLEPIGYTGTYAVTTTTRANYQECLSGDCSAYAPPAKLAAGIRAEAGARVR